MMDAVFRPADVPDHFLVAVSARGIAPPETASPTAFLARRFADSLGYPQMPIVRASQVHGSRVIVVSEAPAANAVVDAGECDALVTSLPGVALAVQTADCVPVILAAADAVGVVHAGWRGAAAGVAREAAHAFLALTRDPDSVRAWLGPAIGPCCYEVGPEVAGRFAPELSHAADGGKIPPGSTGRRPVPARSRRAPPRPNHATARLHDVRRRALRVVPPGRNPSRADDRPRGTHVKPPRYPPVAVPRSLPNGGSVGSARSARSLPKGGSVPSDRSARSLPKGGASRSGSGSERGTRRAVEPALASRSPVREQVPSERKRR